MWIFEWVFGWIKQPFFEITSPGKTYHLKECQAWLSDVSSQAHLADTDDQARFCTMASQPTFADDTSQATYHIEDD